MHDEMKPIGYLGRFLSSGKMKNGKMNFILPFFIYPFATLSYWLSL